MGERATWTQVQGLQSRSYVCGYCGDRVGPDKGYTGQWNVVATGNPNGIGQIFICSRCGQPTYFDRMNRQWPGVAAGRTVNHLPENIRQLYEEARRCVSVAAHTTAAMACRKLLLNVAVAKGAKTNQGFRYYVNWLVSERLVPPGADAWLGHIKDQGNHAAHEIEPVSKEDAEHVLALVEGLLTFVYELPARVRLPEPDEPPQLEAG